MKSILLAALFLATGLAATAQAARAKLDPIARNPYVSAIVIDADTGQPLFTRNAVAPAYPASVLKLMDLYIVLDLVQQGRLNLSDMVSVRDRKSVV